MNNPNNRPLISIVMPIFNANPYLEESIGSCLRQTYSNWELLCVDDCSTDGSLVTLRLLATKDKRIHVFSNSENGGSSKARNAGIKMAKGCYLCFLDADDWLKSNFLEEQLKFCQQKGPFVFSSYDRFYQGKFSTFLVRKRVTEKQCAKGCDISCLTAFIDIGKMGKTYFDESVLMHEDLLYWIGLLRRCGSACGNSESLAVYRIVEHSKSKNKAKGALILFNLYHKKLGYTLIKSFIDLCCVVKYSKQKYSDIR